MPSERACLADRPTTNPSRACKEAVCERPSPRAARLRDGSDHEHRSVLNNPATGDRNLAPGEAQRNPGIPHPEKPQPRTG